MTSTISVPATPERSVLTFSNIGDVVDMGKRPQHKIQRDITMEAWICASRQIKWAGIISKIFDTNATESGFCLTLDGQSGVYCGIRTVGGPAQDFYYSSGANTITLNKWHHVAATYDGKQICLYVDGDMKMMQPYSGNINHDPENFLTIGTYRDDNENFVFPGRIAEVRLWDIPRTQEQIKNTMNVSLQGDEEGLVGYWPMNEGSGNLVSDHSKNAINGNIAGATWQNGCDLPPAKLKAVEIMRLAEEKAANAKAEAEKAKAELASVKAELETAKTALAALSKKHVIKESTDIPGTDAGNLMATAFHLSSSGTNTISGTVGGSDNNDFYKIVAAKTGEATIKLDNLSANLDLRLLDSTGKTIDSKNLGTASENISTTVEAGKTYFVRVYSRDGAVSNYTLTVKLP
jgi:hypothetical protein